MQGPDRYVRPADAVEVEQNGLGVLQLRGRRLPLQGLQPERGRDRDRGCVRAVGAPFRKAVLAVPPPGVGRSMVVTCSVVVEVMCWPAIAAVRTLLGLLTMAWVMPVSPAPEVLKFVWLVRVCSGKSIVWVGGPPMPNGLIPLIAMFGPAPAEYSKGLDPSRAETSLD